MQSLRTTDLRCQADVLHVLSGLHHTTWRRILSDKQL